MRVVLEVDGEEHEVAIARSGEVVKVEVGGESFEVKVAENGALLLGQERHVVTLGKDREATLDGRPVSFRIVDLQSGGGPGEGKAGGRGARLKPPMPGKIVSVAVHEGEEVKAGQVLLILEAMKMQNEIPSPAAGVVKKVLVKPGQNVEGERRPHASGSEDCHGR